MLKKIIGLCVMGALPHTLYAAKLDSIEMFSKYSEPLSAQIPLSLEEGESLEDIVLHVDSALGITGRIVHVQANDYHIRLSSQSPISQPYLELSVRLLNAQDTLLATQQYAVLLGEKRAPKLLQQPFNGLLDAPVVVAKPELPVTDFGYSDYDAVIKQLRKTTQAFPEHATAHAELAKVYRQLAEIAELNRQALVDKRGVSSVSEKRQEGLAEKDMRSMVDAWRQAWQDGDLATYISFYSDTFVGAKTTHEDWLADRKQRFSQSSQREIRLQNIRIQMTDVTRMSVEFTQLYRSNSYQDTTEKRLRWENIDGRWLIVRELALSLKR